MQITYLFTLIYMQATHTKTQSQSKTLHEWPLEAGSPLPNSSVPSQGTCELNALLYSLQTRTLRPRRAQDLHWALLMGQTLYSSGTTAHHYPNTPNFQPVSSPYHQ